MSGHALHLHHEEVRARRDVAHAHFLQVFKGQIAIFLVDSQPFFHQAGANLHAGGGTGCRGNRHEAGAAELADLSDQVRAPINRPGAKARHAIDFRKGPEHHDVLVRFDQIGRHVLRAGKVDVGLVDDQHGILRLVRQNVLQVFPRSERAGGIVGVADVESPGVRVGLDHGFHVVRIILPQRHLDGLRANKAACATAVARTAHHPASGGRSEGGRAVRQGNTGTRKRDHMVLRNIFGAGEQGVELEIVTLRPVAPAHGRDFVESLQPFFAGPHRIFVGRDADHFRIVSSSPAPACTAGSGGGLLFGLLCQGKFVEERNGCSGSHGNSSDLPAGKASLQQ